MRNLVDNPLLLIVLLLIIVLVFGAKRLPDAARSVGRSMRIFKSEMRDMRDDDPSSSAASTSAVRAKPGVVDTPALSAVDMRDRELGQVDTPQHRR